MRLRTLASIAAALLLPVLLSSPASAYDMGRPRYPRSSERRPVPHRVVDQEGVLWTLGQQPVRALGPETQETGTD